jgi:ribosomal protein S18 acetylase RimI-like enzyme
MPTEPVDVAVELRPCTHADREFLVSVYGSARAAELSMVGWSDAERDAFIRMQFDLQDRSYAARFPDAERSVVLLADRPIGRLYVHRDEHEIRIIDVAILPEFRSRGIGSAVIRAVVAEGERTGRPVRIHVESFNPARRLYERLGFVPVSSGGVYHEMEWRP